MKPLLQYSSRWFEDIGLAPEEIGPAKVNMPKYVWVLFTPWAKKNLGGN